jgi:hypothetical protein
VAERHKKPIFLFGGKVGEKDQCFIHFNKELVPKHLPGWLHLTPAYISRLKAEKKTYIRLVASKQESPARPFLVDVN